MSGNSAFVVMMQTTDFPNFDDFAFVGSLYQSALWCVFAQRQMCAPAMVVGTEWLERSLERAFVDDDHMIQALPTDGSN